MLGNLAEKCQLWKLTFLRYWCSLYTGSQRAGVMVQISQHLDFFHTVDCLFLFSSSPNHLLNEPLLLVGICRTPQVCGAEQLLRTLVLC